MPFAFDHHDINQKPKTIIEEVHTGVHERALHAMKELEGWCTDNKATILMDLILKHQMRTIVEIGVFGGKSLVPMAFALKSNGVGKIYGIDPWSVQESIDGQDGANREWWGSIDHDKIMNDLISKIYKFGLHGQIELIRNTSEGTPLIPEIGLLHIDGNHAENKALLDLQKWVPCVKSGGFIVFDDIYWTSTKRAVEWLDQHCVRIADYTDYCGWGIWLKP